MSYLLDLPEGFGQSVWTFTGAALRYPANVILGHTIIEADDNPATNAALLVTAFNTHLKAQCPNNIILNRVLLKHGPLEDGPAAEANANSAGTGIYTVGASAVAVVVRKNTPIGGKRSHGRSYWPFAGESAVDPGGLLVTSYTTALQTAMNAFYAQLANDHLGLYLLHRTREPGTLRPDDPGAPAPAPHLVTNLNVQGVVGTQRRRQRR